MYYLCSNVRRLLFLVLQALSSKGEVWSWGKNLSGQLGIGSLNHQINPVKVEALLEKDVFRIACGGDTSIAVLGTLTAPFVA